MRRDPLEKFTIKRGTSVHASPRVSVIMPAFNAKRFIAGAIRSVMEQSFEQFELIVINDGSPDTPELEEALKPFFDNIVYVSQSNHGAGPARNRGIQLSRGDLIAFLDADDEWLPSFLDEQTQLIENGWDMVYADADLVGEAAPSGQTFMHSAPSSGEVSAASLLDFRCNVITSGTLARRSALEKAGLFESSDTRAQDFHLWVRMARAGCRITYNKKVLLRYRVHTDNLSGDSISRVEREIAVFNRIRSTIPLSPEETSILESRLAGLEVDLEVERGKSKLLGQDFEAALRSFAKANETRPSLKLRVTCFGLKLWPRLILLVYRKTRSETLGLIRTENAVPGWTVFSVISALLRLFSE